MWYWLKKLFRKKQRVLCRFDISITLPNGQEWTSENELVECTVLEEATTKVKVKLHRYNKVFWVSKMCIVEYLN